MKEIYTIKKGVMRNLPEDWDTRQVVKYIAFVVLGYVLHMIQTAYQVAQAAGGLP